MKSFSANDIVRECTAALELLSEASPNSDLRPQVLALLCLLRANLLPPPQQSLNTIAYNLQNALRSLEKVDPLLHDITQCCSFVQSNSKEALEPSHVRAALAMIHSFRGCESRLIARAASAFIARHALATESSFLNELLLRVVPLSGGTSVMDVHCGTGLRSIQAQQLVASQYTSAQPTQLLRVRAEEADATLQGIARMLTSLWDMQVEYGEDLLGPSDASLRSVDRLFVEARTQPPDFSRILLRLAEHSIAAIIMNDEASAGMLRQHMSYLLERDVLDTVITVRSNVRPTWHVLLLRGRRAVERRHRVLFYDHIDADDGPEIDAFGLENIAEAVQNFQAVNDRSRVMHRNDILASSRVIPLASPPPLSRFHMRDTFPGALSAQQFVELDSQLIQRGLDVHPFFTPSSRNDHYHPAFQDHSLVRVAVASAPTLKNAEVRTQYAFASWWNESSPLLLIDGINIHSIAHEFEARISAENVLSPKRSRAVFRSWWNSISDDRDIATRSSALSLAYGWIRRYSEEAESKGRRFWFELHPTDRLVLEYLCPDIVRGLHASDAALNSLIQQQAALNPLPTVALTDRLLRRREEHLMDDVHYAAAQLDSVRERIAELRQIVERHKKRMAELHAEAKAYRTSEQRREVFDETRDMQDELGSIFAHLVPAQSELVMLEKSLKPYDELESRRQRENTTLDSFTARLLPALNDVRNLLSPQLASSLVLLQFREQLSRRVEQAISNNRDELIRELEGVWRRLEQSSTFAPQQDIVFGPSGVRTS